MINIFLYQARILFLLLLLSSLMLGKNNECKLPDKADLMAHLRFIASDELKGRKPGTDEIRIVARYIAEQFRAYGLKQFSKYDSYLQPVELNIDNNIVYCNNVLGYLDGSDKSLKSQYILLMAHYDHLGVIVDTTKVDQDSIYNGARDNGMGVVALLFAAKYFSINTPKRPIIFLATTGEEEGMLGSKYFVDNCTINLNDIVFVLNNDGGGYNDTTKIRVGGKNRVNFQPDFWKEFVDPDLEYLAYPDELSYLYKLGDNISFADEGIPAITISPGFNEVNEELMKYVHQPIDEADNNFNYSYLLKFSKAFSLIAKSISNSDLIPFWKKDDKHYIEQHSTSKQIIYINSCNATE